MTAELTPARLQAAAHKTRQVNDVLNEVISHPNLPLLMGFDLDFLADQFEEAAAILRGLQ